MKKILLLLSLVSLTISCDRNNSYGSVEDEMVEIPFEKEGELEFLNENGEPFKKINIEIADTPNKRARGLMDRSKLEENDGMLFIFNDSEVTRQTFYMKNTRIPLDIMYFSADTVLINIARNAQPGEESAVSGGTVAPSMGEAKFVVEINGGLADTWGMKEGVTKIRWNRTN